MCGVQVRMHAHMHALAAARRPDADDADSPDDGGACVWRAVAFAPWLRSASHTRPLYPGPALSRTHTLTHTRPPCAAKHCTRRSHRRSTPQAFTPAPAGMHAPASFIAHSPLSYPHGRVHIRMGVRMHVRAGAHVRARPARDQGARGQGPGGCDPLAPPSPPALPFLGRPLCCLLPFQAGPALPF